MSGIITTTTFTLIFAILRFFNIIFSSAYITLYFVRMQINSVRHFTTIIKDLSSRFTLHTTYIFRCNNIAPEVLIFICGLMFCEGNTTLVILNWITLVSIREWWRLEAFQSDFNLQLKVALLWLTGFHSFTADTEGDMSTHFL